MSEYYQTYWLVIREDLRDSDRNIQYHMELFLDEGKPFMQITPVDTKHKRGLALTRLELFAVLEDMLFERRVSESIIDKVISDGVDIVKAPLKP